MLFYVHKNSHTIRMCRRAWRWKCVERRKWFIWKEDGTFQPERAREKASVLFMRLAKLAIAEPGAYGLVVQGCGRSVVDSGVHNRVCGGSFVAHHECTLCVSMRPIL